MNNTFRVTYFFAMLVAVVQFLSIIVALSNGHLALYAEWLSIAFTISCLVLVLLSFSRSKYKSIALIIFSLFLILISIRDLQSGILGRPFDSFIGFLFQMILLLLAFLVPVLGLIGGIWKLTHARNENT